MNSNSSSKNNELNSLALLEECLSLVYASRKNTLEIRAKDYAAAMQKKKARAQFHRQRIVIESTNNSLDKEEDAQQDVYEEISSKFKAVKANSSKTTASVSATPHAGSPEKKLNPKEENKQLFKNTNTFSTAEGMAGDNDSVSLLNGCKLEIVKWWEDNKVRRDDDESRGEFADYLTDKYLSNKLDKMPSSKVITTTRKSVSALIESFASDGVVDDSMYEVNEGVISNDVMKTEVVQSAASTMNNKLIQNMHINDVLKKVSFVEPEEKEREKKSKNNNTTSNTGASSAQPVSEKQLLERKYVDMKAKQTQLMK